MKNESISISSRTLRTLSELKEPSESVSDFISKLLEQHEKQSLLAEELLSIVVDGKGSASDCRSHFSGVSKYQPASDNAL